MKANMNILFKIRNQIIISEITSSILYFLLKFWFTSAFVDLSELFFFLGGEVG